MITRVSVQLYFSTWDIELNGQELSTNVGISDLLSRKMNEIIYFVNIQRLILRKKNGRMPNPTDFNHVTGG